MEPEKNTKNQSTRINGEERTTGPKSKSDDDWRAKAKHEGTSLLFTVLVSSFYSKGQDRYDSSCKSCILNTKAARRAKAKKLKKQSKDKVKRNRGAVLSVADFVLVETVESIGSPHLHKIVEEYVNRIAREDIGGFE